MIHQARRKRAIPQATRRAVALRNGARPLERGTPAQCAYCDYVGSVNWMTPSWVRFTGLELDHVIPEYLGGDGSPENIVLACRRCNRRRGHRAVGQPREEATA